METCARSRPQIAAIILAAGGSVRMGEPKQLLSVGGQPMVRRVTEAVCAAGLGQVAIIVGAHAEAVRQALAGLPVDIVVNERWAEGMSTSVRVGLGIVQPGTQAALIVLADQPALTPGLIQVLVARYLETEAPIVVPIYQGRRGNPVLFDRKLFAELLRVEGDQGGRLLVRRYQQEIELVEVDDPAVVLDIDTHQDYKRVKDMDDEDGLRRQ